MKPLSTQPLADQKEKMRYVFEQAEKCLETTIGAYDALSSKVFTLFSVEVGIISLLVGFIAVGHALSTPLGWVALLYAGFLAASAWQCWKAMESKEFFHVGRTPLSFSTPELNKTLPAILSEQCRRHQNRIDSNRKKVSDCAARLQAAMSLFLAGTLLSVIAALAVATTQDVVIGLDGHGANFIQDGRGWGGFRDGRPLGVWRGHR
jgi:hypothetical protein